MGKRARRSGISNAAVRVARAAFMAADDEAAAVAQRVYNATHEAKTSGECGDVSPLLWGPVVVAAEMAAAVVVRMDGLKADDAEDVAAYFVAMQLAAAQFFDFAHFERWRRGDVAGEGGLEPG